MNRILAGAVAATVMAMTTGAIAQTKWDLPAAYPAGNFHTTNLQKFADGVKAASGGKLEITVHANGSLYKAPEIKRAVQSGQAQIGEVLMVNLQNEDAAFGADGVPFLGPTPIRNLYVNTGHGHLGWTMACGSAKAVAAVIAGDRPDIDLSGMTLDRR